MGGRHMKTLFVNKKCSECEKNCKIETLKHAEIICPKYLKKKE
jgi:hypothetical protein